MSRCESCGTCGQENSQGAFVSDDWMRCQNLQSEINRLTTELTRMTRNEQLQMERAIKADKELAKAQENLEKEKENSKNEFEFMWRACTGWKDRSDAAEARIKELEHLTSLQDELTSRQSAHISELAAKCDELELALSEKYVKGMEEARDIILNHERINYAVEARISEIKRANHNRAWEEVLGIEAAESKEAKG